MLTLNQKQDSKLIKEARMLGIQRATKRVFAAILNIDIKEMEVHHSSLTFNSFGMTIKKNSSYHLFCYYENGRFQTNLITANCKTFYSKEHSKISDLLKEIKNHEVYSMFIKIK